MAEPFDVENVTLLWRNETDTRREGRMEDEY